MRTSMVVYPLLIVSPQSLQKGDVLGALFQAKFLSRRLSAIQSIDRINRCVTSLEEFDEVIRPMHSFYKRIKTGKYEKVIPSIFSDQNWNYYTNGGIMSSAKFEKHFERTSNIRIYSPIDSLRLFFSYISPQSLFHGFTNESMNWLVFDQYGADLRALTNNPQALKIMIDDDTKTTQTCEYVIPNSRLAARDLGRKMSEIRTVLSPMTILNSYFIPKEDPWRKTALDL